MFETERLFLRKLLESDLDDIFAMRKDPLVMRFIREPQTDIKSSAKWIEMMRGKWDEKKIGFFAVEEKATGNFVGWCGLWELPGTNEIEVGYAIAPNFWGKGYATEAAKRFLEYGFEELELKKIVAVAFPKNKASQNVMKKLGMNYVGEGIFYDKELVQYAISKDKFLESRS